MSDTIFKDLIHLTIFQIPNLYMVVEVDWAGFTPTPFNLHEAIVQEQSTARLAITSIVRQSGIKLTPFLFQKRSSFKQIYICFNFTNITTKDLQ